jgi:hypothetical protein
MSALPNSGLRSPPSPLSRTLVIGVDFFGESRQVENRTTLTMEGKDAEDVTSYSQRWAPPLWPPFRPRMQDQLIAHSSFGLSAMPTLVPTTEMVGKAWPRRSHNQSLVEKEGGPPFDWDIAINAGDTSGAQRLPLDEEGQEIVRQFRTLKKHKREDIYDICGNHDRGGLDEPDAWWFQKWLDPLGQHTKFSDVNPARRPYPINGTWERYSFRVGNILFLMMSDRNEPSQRIGRGTLGGNPGGVVSGETFAW